MAFDAKFEFRNFRRGPLRAEPYGKRRHETTALVAGETREPVQSIAYRSTPEGAQKMSLKDIVVLLDPSRAGGSACGWRPASLGTRGLF